VVATRAPWWNLPYRKIALWSLSAILIYLPISIWLSQGRKWAIGVCAAFSAVWCLGSVWTAVRLQHPLLGYYTVILLLYFSAVIAWLRHEISRSFFDPQLKWYQGLPRPIPGLYCELVLGDRKADFRVSRIDREGAFLFSEGRKGEEILPLELARLGGKPDLVFHFRDRELKCQGHAMRVLSEGLGVGLQFVGLTPDVRKQMGDFVELLQGEGYVQ
jgi:hypothetical protein